MVVGNVDGDIVGFKVVGETDGEIAASLVIGEVVRMLHVGHTS